jgi:hypothetical protein
MDRPRRTIANLMWIVVLAAVWLLATRGGLDADWLARYWFLLILGAVALHWAWFVLVPRCSLDLAGGDRDRQSRLLRWVINTPIPGGPKLRARQTLAANDHAAGRYEEAEAGYRSLLRDSHDGRDLPPGMEATLRRQLADTLEAMGRPEEAAAQRARQPTVAEDPDAAFPDPP